MSEARRASDGRKLSADVCSPNDAPFQCAGCGASVIRVKGYWAKKDDPDLARYVQALFRLAPGDLNTHTDNCPYTPAGQVKLLVDRARAVEDSVNPFSQEEPGKAVVFRINIPTHEAAALTAAVKAAGAEPLTPAQRAERIWTGRRIHSYCHSALGLAKIWQALDSTRAQDDLRRRVRIDLDGHSVSWADFFYAPEDLHRLVQKIGSRQLAHPIAALITARKIDQVKIQSTQVPEPGTDPEIRVVVELYGSPEIIRDCVAGQHYIAFGNFWVAPLRPPWTPKNSGKTYQFINLRLKLYRPEQIERVDVVDAMRSEDE